MTDLDKLIEAVEAAGFVGPSLIFHLHENAHLAFSAHYGSLDAAKALHEALLPGWGWLIGDKRTACVSPPKSTTDGRFGIAEGNPARAWLIAILKAYRSLQ